MAAFKASSATSALFRMTMQWVYPVSELTRNDNTPLFFVWTKGFGNQPFLIYNIVQSGVGPAPSDFHLLPCAECRAKTSALSKKLKPRGLTGGSNLRIKYDFCSLEIERD